MVQQMMSFYKEDKNALPGSCSRLCSLAGSVPYYLGMNFQAQVREKGLVVVTHSYRALGTQS